MAILHLSIKEGPLKEILAGEKSIEYRDFSEYYKKKLCILDNAGGIIDAKKFDFIRFHSGQYQNRYHADVELIEIFSESDDEGHIVHFALDLGRIISPVKLESNEKSQIDS